MLRKGYYFIYFFIAVSFFISVIFISCRSSKSGCTDPASINFNTDAKTDDGTCIYADVLLSPQSIVSLSSSLKETSGLAYSNGRIWTFTDGGGANKIFSIKPKSGNIKEETELIGVLNVDFEAMSQSETHFFVGDVGNNNGNRTDLVIYKFPKIYDTLIQNSNQSVVETIHFNYPEQTDFRTNTINNWDCEAMFYSNNYIYIFLKEHTLMKTTMYQIPAAAGTYQAKQMGVFDAKGLITDAAISPDGTKVILLGRNIPQNKSFFWMLKDFQNEKFFSGKKTYVELGPMNIIGQNEGVCFYNNDSIFISNEQLGTVPPNLYGLNISTIK